MNTLKKIGIGAAALLGAAALGVVSFGLELGSIHVQGFLNKERANVERQEGEAIREPRRKGCEVHQPRRPLPAHARLSFKGDFS